MATIRVVASEPPGIRRRLQLHVRAPGPVTTRVRHGALPAVFAALATFAPAGHAWAQAIRGTVVDASTGDGISQAAIAVSGGGHTATGTSNDDGEFVVYLRSGGRYEVRAARIGYLANDAMMVDVGARELVEMTLSLTTTPIVLGGFRVEARRSDPRLLATHEGLRARHGTTPGVGARRVVVSTDPVMANAGTVRDVLRWFLPPRGCIDYYVDGQAVDPRFWADLIPTLSPRILEGIEFYRDDWSRPLGFGPAPRPLNLAGATCSVIAVWRVGR